MQFYKGHLYISNKIRQIHLQHYLLRLFLISYNLILNMRVYSLIYNFFDCISCKTLPNDFDPFYDSDDENEELPEWPYSFFMVR